MFSKKNNDKQKLQLQLSELYDLYVDKVFRFIFFKTNDVYLAEDLTSDVFLKLWDFLLQNKPIRNQKSFIYSIARNLVIDYYRQKKQIIFIDKESENNYSIARQDFLLHNINIKTEMIPVYKALQKIKSEYREVILLKYIEELSIKEISEILNKKKGAVRILLHRALIKLRKHLNEDSSLSS